MVHGVSPSTDGFSYPYTPLQRASSWGLRLNPRGGALPLRAERSAATSCVWGCDEPNATLVP
jgi:hypothetical protein